MDLRLTLLREFCLERSGTCVEVPASTQRLLAFLALRGPAHRCHVAGTLWPDVPERQALASLRTGVWRINRIQADLVECDGSVVGIPAAMQIDSRDQEGFATDLLRERVEDDGWIGERLGTIWPGELLPGWYDDWVVFERERLSQLRLHALEYLAALMVRRNNLDFALQLALEAVRTEPLRETANARLIEVYLAEGNVYDAVHQYDSYRALLDRELGLAPSPAVTGLLPAVRRR